MITIIDTIRHSEEHAPFNAAFSTLLLLNNSDEPIDVYFQNDQIGNISKILVKNNIPLSSFCFHETYVFAHQNKPFKILICYLISLVQDLRLLNKAKKGAVFYTSANPLALYFIKLSNILLRKKIYIVIHGELEYLNKENDQNHPFPNNLMRKWYRLIFWKLLDQNIKYIILGENIFRNIQKFNQDKVPDDNFICIDHPYFYPEFHSVHDQNPYDLRVRYIGTIGHTAVAKNSHKIFELAALMEESIAAGKISFKIIGNISTCMMPYINKFVEIQSKKSFMPRKMYEEEINSLSYIVFFYSDSLYQFIASGVFFDAIAFEKPIIALRNSFFEYYFEKYSDIGYLCNNIAEMKIVLNNFDPQRYHVQVENIKRLKDDLSINKIAVSLNKQLKIPIQNQTIT